ncbi:MAG: glycosyltransferase family 4 protein [Flavobacteriales bacterium]|nr:glycosyltransferase family 4 protein [Flavobacteriales bacterium]
MVHVDEAGMTKGDFHKLRCRWVDKGDATFIASDLDLLSDRLTVQRVSFRERGVMAGIWLVRQFLFGWVSVFRADVVVVHFGGWHALPHLFWARVFRKRSLLFLHGVDCVAIPEIGYGNFTKVTTAWVTRSCFRLARVLVPVHASLVERTDAYTLGGSGKQGVKVHDLSCTTPIQVVPHGFDPSRWPLGEGARNGFVTVAVDAFGTRTFRLKGIDLFIEAASHFPDHPFTIVGALEPIPTGLPVNVTVLPLSDPRELASLYRGSLAYVQLSLSEGFGYALAEAMLSGCVPIVSAAGSLPDVSGGCGPVVREHAPPAVVEAMQRVIQGAYVGGGAPRTSIAARYPLERRKQALSRLLSGQVLFADPGLGAV